jgi:hypothetical protein
MRELLRPSFDVALAYVGVRSGWCNEGRSFTL